MAETPSAAASPQTDILPAQWEEAGWLPCQMSVDLPVHNFSVRDLLELSVGSLVQTEWKSGGDAPLRANGQQFGWVEFEQLGDSVGVRLTDLW
jgi:flagellar motor switch/type III secretory pathway protein FliN